MSTLEATAEAANRRNKTRYGADGVYGEVLNFLIDEAALLDDDRHMEWLAQLTEDVTYKMPYRENLYRRDGQGFTERNAHFNDDILMLKLRVRRNVEIASPLDRDPPPRIRRMVSNVVVHDGDAPGEYEVTSTLLLTRSRFDRPTREFLSARREDVIRRTPEGLRLARRTILVDQGAVGGSYINVFM